MSTNWLCLAAAAGAAALAAVSASACRGGPRHPTTAATTAPAATVVVTAPTVAPGSTSASTPATTAAGSTIAGPAGCRSIQLSAAVTNASGAAGTIYSHLTFTNRSGTPCTLTGYPGVSFVDGAGHQIGAPLKRLSGYGGTVIVRAAGGTAAALFLYHDAYVGTAPECMSPVPAAGLRVYPPGDTAALFVADPTMACASAAATGVGEIGAVTDPTKLPG